MQGHDDPLAAWARSGAMALTGRADGPALGPPAGFVERLQALGDRLQVDALALLGERAALAGWQRQGDRSCGGATRLLRAGDGWLALSLARSSDEELLAAWLGGAVEWDEDPWSSLAPAVADRSVDELVAGGALLGLPVAGLPPVKPAATDGLPIRRTEFGLEAPAGLGDLLVVDLSALWAGPLCAQLLGRAGARIVKVESTRRPDGARFGPPAFFDLLHAGHESVAVDFTTPAGRRDLRSLVEAADIVIEASRPRALQQLGIDAEELLRAGRPRWWLSITGYGRSGDAARRVAFGDDGAVAGGLVVWDDRGPCFCADAVADPLTGLVGAAAVIDAVASGGRGLLDVSLQAVAEYFAARSDGRPATPDGPVEVAAPRARPVSATAAPIGAHTEAVLAEIRRRRE